jgi:hypothetical protein
LRTLLILRAHKADSDTFAAYDRYCGLRSADVVICCDERDGAVDMGGRSKLAWDRDTLTALGLFAHPRCGWRCGDYAYYVTRAARPDYDRYWLVEPDVLINVEHLDAAFDQLNGGDADFLAARFSVRDERWEWARTMRHRYDKVYGCIFPLTRLSAGAIDHLHAARRAALVPELQEAFANWPNDEVFVATELCNHGFTCLELASGLPGSYTRATLRTAIPHDRAALQAGGPDGLIYHPVRDFRTWFEDRSRWAADYGQRRRAGVQSPSRGHVMQLLGLAAAAFEQEGLGEAAVFPLMLARDQAADAETPDNTDLAQVDLQSRQGRAARMLARDFGPRRNGRVFATAHLLGAMADRRPLGVATVADFTTGVAVPLHMLPARFALPYAFDFDADSLLLTIHALPAAVLSADSVLEEQRRSACVGCLVHVRHLPRFYPLEAARPDPLFLVMAEASARKAEGERLRSRGVRAVVDPPALMQLAASATRFLEVRAHWQAGLLLAAIAPAFLTYGAPDGPVVFVVSEDVLRLRGALAAVFAGCRIVRDADAVV